MTGRLLRLAIAAALLCTGQVTEKHLAFEVVSIRRNMTGVVPVRPGPTPDGFRSIGLPLVSIFQWAYAPGDDAGPLRGDRIVGGPDWLREDRYDVIAKVDDADLAEWRKPAMQPPMLRAMLQAMLADRFTVAVHRESKEVPVYDLVIAKGGPKFRQAETTDAAELRQKHPDGALMTGGAGALVVPGPSGMQFYGVSMAMLVQTWLPSVTDRPVIDKTGLTGRYDFALPSSALPPQRPASDDQESIFTSLPGALGLRLESAKGAVEMLVIDHVERPSEN